MSEKTAEKKAAGKPKTGKARKAGKIAGYAAAGIGSFILCLVIAYFVYPKFGAIVDGYYDGALQAMAPEHPRWPSEDPADQAVFDNEALTVTADETCLYVEYSDESMSFEAPRVSVLDMMRLRSAIDKASISWLNAHTGTCYIVYTFASGGDTWHFYQHLHDTGYVFCRKEAGYVQTGGKEGS